MPPSKQLVSTYLSSASDQKMRMGPPSQKVVSQVILSLDEFLEGANVALDFKWREQGNIPCFHYLSFMFLLYVRICTLSWCHGGMKSEKMRSESKRGWAYCMGMPELCALQRMPENLLSPGSGEER